MKHEIFKYEKKVSRFKSAKTMLFGIVLSILAGMPLLSTLLPDNVDYDEMTQTVLLTSGQNQIDDIAITLDQSGKVVHAEQINRQITNQVFGFRNFRAFLTAGVPFFSLLAFCLFFFWYDKQPKTSHILTLKRYTWRIFSFVSLWFLYWLTIPNPATLSYASYSLGTYMLTGVSLFAVHHLYHYYCSAFRHKHRKIAGLISYIFEVRYKHYSRMARKALHRKQAQGQTRQHIQAYETQTFEILSKVAAQPRSVSNAKPPKRKFILIGLLLSILAITPLLYQFASTHVDYIKTTKTILLKPGLNRIGPLSLTLSPQGTVLKVQKTERQIIHKVFGYENMKVFLEDIAPFLTSLSLCLFFFWYEQQQKNPHLLALKRYVWTVFLLVSLWCVCWALIPEVNPISNELYQVGTYIAICFSIASLQYLKRSCVGKLEWVCAQATSLLLYVFGVKKRHYPRMATKAMDNAADYPETCREIEEYHKRTDELIANSKEFMTDPKLRREYDDYKRFRIDP